MIDINPFTIPKYLNLPGTNSLPFIGLKVRIRCLILYHKKYIDLETEFAVFFFIKTAKFDIDAIIRKSTLAYWDASLDVLRGLDDRGHF